MASITNMSPALREHMASVGCAPVGPDGLGVLNPIPESSSALGSGLNSIMLGASIGQAIGGIYSAFVGAKTSAYVQKKQAQIAQDNAEIMRMGAETAYRQGEQKVAQITRRAGQLKGAQRARYAANGVALGVGNVAEVATNTDLDKEMDVWTAKFNAMQAAWGYNRKSLEYGAQSGALRTMSGANNSLAPVAALGAGLSGATQVASNWYMYNGKFGLGLGR